MLAADKIKRLNRLYAVSSGINEAIVRVPGEHQLYLEACRIAVERGGFSMAWVGRNDPKEGRLVPIARWGHDDGYVDTIHITTGTDRREGLGPGGTAFRTGHASVCNDIESDTQYFAFREEALSRGFRSCAAFPLKQHGKSIGVFFVYSNEPLYFDEQELALLTSLADNFSFAIEARDRQAEQSRIEGVLRTSEARLRAIVNNEPDCVKIISPGGILLDMNPAGLAMMEATEPEQVIGHNVAEFVHPDDLEAFMALCHQALAGHSGHLQARAVGLRGRVVWMDVQAVPLPSEDGVASVMCITRDVTQQRRAMETLQQNQALLSIASRLGRIGASSIDLPSLKVTWSDELSLIHEMPAGFSPTFERTLDFYPAEHRGTVIRTFRACAEKGRPFDVQLEILTASGKRVKVRSIGEAVRDATGRVVRVQGAFQDITDQLAAQQEILRLNGDLEQRVRQRTAQLEVANGELEAFSYSIAHDLRAPLMAIGGFSQALQAMVPSGSSERFIHYVDRMREGVHRTSDMIDALLSLAQVTRTELRWEPVDLTALAHRAAEHHREQQPERAVTLRIQPGMTAMGDSRLLRLVLDNLVANAWKFTSGREEAIIEFVAQPNEEGETVYEMRDNGVGFDMQYAKNLFGAFQRMHHASDFPGTGIGLANVRRIVSRHSGRIWAHARPGEGAAFYFTLGDEPA